MAVYLELRGLSKLFSHGLKLNALSGTKTYIFSPHKSAYPVSTIQVVPSVSQSEKVVRQK